MVALVPDAWGLQWQPRHHVLVRLAEYFHVVWVSPAPNWRAARTIRNIENGQDNTTGLPPGFIIYRPEFWLPRFHRPSWLADFTFRSRLQRASRLLLDQGCKKIIVYLWRPEFHDALRLVRFDHSFYHIDDEYSFSSVEVPLSPEEVEVISAANAVFIHSPGLLEKKGNINPCTLFVPNGVDFKMYSRIVKEPADITLIPHPRIGYTGNIKKQLNWELITELADRHSDWSFVFVGEVLGRGEVQEAIERLLRRGNTYFLGGKSASELAEYPQHFDTCIMPYRSDDYTQYIYPLKLHEYLASGRPVVGTRIRSLSEFEELIALAANQDEWSAALLSALAPEANTPQKSAERQKIAKQHDWDLLVRKIAREMLEHLDSLSAKERASSLKKLEESLHPAGCLDPS